MGEAKYSNYADMRLGEILVHLGVVGHEQLEDALRIQKGTGQKIGEIMVAQGMCTPEDVAEALAKQMRLARAPRGFWDKPPAKDIPAEVAVRYKIYPMRVEGSHLYIATSDPLDFATIDEIRYTTGFNIVSEVATPNEVERALRRWYGFNNDDKAIDTMWDEPEEAEDDAEGPAVKAAVDIINGALIEGASDIHIEPGKEHSTVRYRIDGLLREVMKLPRKMHPAVVSRIKVMAGLDIADRRLPQDGRIKIKEPREVDLRVSTLPTMLGESVVMRVLDKSRTIPKFEALGYSGSNLEKIKKAIKMPYGLILVTGPTGSGKTTTLYAALSEVVSPFINVITVEDPPEYELSGVKQVAVNTKSGLTFATALRAILRHDPDIIMIGEIRDPETAKIAVQAALTGHLVLSTLHTNDAASAPARLIDMGVEPYLVASCLVCVIAQRLVRKVCEDCAESYEPSSDSPVGGFLNGSLSGKSTVVLRRGKGCPICGSTGFRGRTAVAEVMVATRAVRELIRRSADADVIKDQAIKDGMIPLLEDARLKVLTGITTAEEAMRVAASAD